MRAVAIAVEGEPVAPAFLAGLDADYRFLAGRNQRLAGHRAADHDLRQFLPRIARRCRLGGEKLPEAADVLPQVAKRDVRAVAPEIAFLGQVLREGQ